MDCVTRTAGGNFLRRHDPDFEPAGGDFGAEPLGRRRGRVETDELAPRRVKRRRDTVEAIEERDFCFPPLAGTISASRAPGRRSCVGGLRSRSARSRQRACAIWERSGSGGGCACGSSAGTLTSAWVKAAAARRREGRHSLYRPQPTLQGRSKSRVFPSRTRCTQGSSMLCYRNRSPTAVRTRAAKRPWWRESITRAGPTDRLSSRVGVADNHARGSQRRKLEFWADCL